MSRLDWEKRNKVEQPKEKRRLSNRSKVLKAYENGTKRERERIIKLLGDYAQKELERLRNPKTKVMTEFNLAYYEGLVEAMFVVKGERK